MGSSMRVSKRDMLSFLEMERRVPIRDFREDPYSSAYEVVWADGYRMHYSTYDLERMTENYMMSRGMKPSYSYYSHNDMMMGGYMAVDYGNSGSSYPVEKKKCKSCGKDEHGKIDEKGRCSVKQEEFNKQLHKLSQHRKLQAKI